MTTQDHRVDLRAWVSRLYRENLNNGRATLGEMFGGHVEVESSGAWLTTSDGEKYLNVGGYGVFLAGARHPAVIREVERQLRTHPVASRMFLEPTLARAAEALVRVTPDGLNRVHFSGSGAEAVETAIKIARAGGRRHLISMRNGYHGKTMGALSVTAKDMFQDPFRPLLADVTHVPFGDAGALADALAEHPDDACVIVEPVQGEAGVIVPPVGYLRDVAALCAQFGALFVLDEIQTGFGRLGAWWGADLEGVVPDVLLSGKGLGGGVLPVAATIATAEAFGVFDRDPFLHTATFSGSPLAMAAVCGSVAAIEEDGLIERTAHLGAILLPEIDRIVRTHLGELVSDVRGVGLLIGVEFTQPALAGELLIDLVEHKVIANHSLNSSRVLRLTPPAVMSDSDVLVLLDALDRAARSTAARYQLPKGAQA
jgi:putrescine aminotransferase